MNSETDEGPVCPSLNSSTLPDLDWALAVTLWEGFYEILAQIPVRAPGSVGRPSVYHPVVFLLHSALTFQLASASKARATLRQPLVWPLVRRNIEHMAGIVLRDAPPSKDQFDYAGKKLANEHVAAINEAFADTAIRLAQHMGCLDPAARFSAADPARGQTLGGDGKVLKTPFPESAAEQRKLKGLPVPAEWGLHAEGGSKHLVYGSKFMSWNVRPGNTRNEQVVLTMEPCGKDEAKVAVRTALDIIDKTEGGTHAIVYDGAFHGVHIEKLQSAGPQVFSPVSKNVKPRHHQLIRCECGTAHDIWLAKGAPHEREILDTGEVHLTPCPTDTPDRRLNKNGRFRWYVNVVLSCGRKRAIPGHLVQRDAATRFNRQENLRLSTKTGEGTSTYDRTYGRRSNSESINRLIQNGLANRQVVGYSINKQWLLLLGLGIARNALAWHLWQRSKAPPGKTA